MVWWTAFIVWLYGSTFIVGAVLSVFFASKAKARVDAIEHPWQTDRLFLLSLAVALITVGLTVTNGGRLIGNVVHGLSEIMLRAEGLPIALGLVVILVGTMFAVRLVDLEKRPPGKLVRNLSVALLAWAAVTAVVAQFIPYTDRLPYWL